VEDIGGDSRIDCKHQESRHKSPPFRCGATEGAFGMSRFVVLQHTSWRGIPARHGAGVVLFVFVIPLLLVVRCSRA
jgi:hypothetical protein